MSKIVIDGNIGAGKTTQVSLLEKHGYNVQKEPIEQWPLELFYSDPVRWAFLFQLVILKSLVVKPGVRIYERCPISSLKVFWELLEKHEIEDEVYKSYYRDYGWSPDIYILVDTPPQVCYERLKTRTQDGDTSVTLEYLQSLYEKYNKMFDEMECPKYKIDGLLSQEEIFKNILDIINNHDAV